MYYRTVGYYGQPLTVFYPGYHSNMTHYPPINYSQPYPRHYHPIYRQYPDVDASLFNESALSMQNLMKDASIVLHEIANSKEFAKKVMMAAQESDLDEVEQLIKSTGIKSNVDTSFNPDGINLKLTSSVGETECCHLTVTLRWR